MFQVGVIMFDNIISKVMPFIGKKQVNGLSVPVFDGVFKPNNLLEEAMVLVEKPGLEDLAVDSRGQLVVACGREVHKVTPHGTLTQIAGFDTDVTALAILPDDSIVVGLGNSVVFGVGSEDQHSLDSAAGKPFVAITAISVQSDGGILICDSSDKYPCADWVWDLMGKKKTGRVIKYASQTREETVLASGLASAFGVIDHAEHGPLISESWAHSVSVISGRKIKRLIDRLPGYPCRFAPSSDGGFWLTLFCSRTQLVEFVLKENDYRQEMMQTIDQKYWISPSFGSGVDFLEPLQSGGVKQMGVQKPWAPPRSYGLVVRLSADLTPLYSMHSRVGGKNHGICAAAQVGDDLYLLSKGSQRVLKLSVSGSETSIFGKAL